MKKIGILPMAGKGSRVQPLAFSKELYPIAYQRKHYAISEFSVRAMMRAHVDEIMLVIHPDKIDIAKYYSIYNAPISMYFYRSPSLPESCLFPIDRLHNDDLCLFGLPDTLFSPANGYLRVVKELEKGVDICLGLFKVSDPTQYDSVAVDQYGNVQGVLVKKDPPLSDWIWGIWGANVSTLQLLKKEIQSQSDRGKRLLGVGFDSLAKKKNVNFKAKKIGKDYFDVGTMDAIVRVNSVIKDFEL